MKLFNLIEPAKEKPDFYTDDEISDFEGTYNEYDEDDFDEDDDEFLYDEDDEDVFNNEDEDGYKFL